MLRILRASSLVFILVTIAFTTPLFAVGYNLTKLVSDQPNTALITDPNLVNAWGIAMSATSPFWVSDNHTDVSTLYGGDAAGSPFTRNSLVVTIPGGGNTGVVFNSTSDFVVTSGLASGPARFIFATEAGTIRTKSPLSCKVSLRLMAEGKQRTDFADEMAAEFALTSHVARTHDFHEGVRALLIDKTGAPDWQPTTPEAVDDAMLDALFAPTATAWTPFANSEVPA